MAGTRGAWRVAWVLAAALAACGGGGGGPVAPPGPACGDGVRAGAEGCDDGNLLGGDGCSAACQPEPGAPLVVACRALDPVPSGPCAATAGDAALLVTGTVLVPGTVYRGGQVLVDAGGTIACVGCDCTAAPGAATAARLTCPGGVVSPGLVNLRDHLTFSQNPPRADGGERYDHRQQWRLGIEGHARITAPGAASAAQVRWGELRHLLGGATATAGAGGQAGLLRNLDLPALQEGLGAGDVYLDSFPLGDSGGPVLASGCAYPAIVQPAAFAGAPGAILDVGEGISSSSRNELLCATGSQGGGADLTGPRSVFAATAAVTAADLAVLAGAGTALVWSPRSNVSLYGDTAPVAAAARLGVQVALGTDWTVTGSTSMLRELACADQWNRERLAGFFSDEQLWLMATRNAADAAGLLGSIGLLAPGRAGDLAVFDGRGRTPHRAVLEAGPAALALVVRGGRVLAGDEALVAALRPAAACDAVDVCGTAKRLCLQDEVGGSYAALQAAAGGAPPAFSCGPPAGEPTCVPSRPRSVSGSTSYTGAITAADRDGDGLPDAQDDCPTVFNPVRPMDGGQQADADGDGEGDACDPCPLDASGTTCTPVDPDDLDGDGIANAVDTCPGDANPDQADRDLDGHGDACDACPDAANPGSAGCPATVYQVKDGTVPAGSPVSLAGVLVTGRAASGFFVQVKAGDAGYLGPDFSGLWIPLANSAVAPGDRVTVDGVVADFFGQRQVVPASAAAVVVSASGEAPPAPVAVAPAEVATGGARAARLEGVVVRLSGVAVTDVAPPPGAGDAAPTNEFVVAGALRVDDLLFLAAPFPAVGTTYDSLTGVLAFRAGDSKVEPRTSGDLVAAPQLATFGPGPAFLRVGAAVTLPAPLLLTLTTPVAADTFVPVASSDPGALAVPGGGVTVPLGQASVPVLLAGLSASPGVTLTATLGVARQATVRVLDGTEAPALAALTPPSASTIPGGAVTLTAALDLPPAAPAAVALSVDPAGTFTCPSTVTVPADALAAAFECTAPAAEGAATVTATLGAGQRSASVSAAAGTHLVINEVDYDTPGVDTAEFVELYNPTGAPVSLSGLMLVLVNGGNGAIYGFVPLDFVGTGALAPGQYLVVGSPSVLAGLPPGTLSEALPTAQDAIQNGAPDGVALIDTRALTVVDALSYEGSLTAATLLPLPGTRSLVEGTALPAAVADANTAPGSLSRLPNGADTDDASVDWKFTSTPTPGTANLP